MDWPVAGKRGFGDDFALWRSGSENTTIEHPAYPDFLATIAGMAIHAASFKGVLYRACSPEYANTRDLLTGDGARKYGGRWNGPGGFPMVYLAQSVEGAIAETLGLAGHYSFDPATRLPLTLVAVDAILAHVLDLSDAKVRKTLGVTIAAMNGCRWRDDNVAGREALTQAIGRAAHESGVQGILVPSSVKRTLRNINVIPKNLGRGDRLEIRRADKLPPPPAPGTL